MSASIMVAVRRLSPRSAQVTNQADTIALDSEILKVCSPVANIYLRKSLILNEPPTLLNGRCL
ncbi:hypothetical protein METHP14_50162 [Pseudomonas sp. P14-2025]